MGTINLPEITIADGQDMLEAPVTLITFVAESDWWPIIRYTIHIMVAAVLLFRMGNFTL
jgi:hypothetical protein